MEKLINKMINLLFKYKDVLNKLMGHNLISINKFTDYYSDNSLMSNYTEKFLRKTGLITNVNNKNCKYFLGKMPCTIQNLKNNNFII